MAGSHRQKPTLYNPRTYTFCFGGLHKHILRHIAQTHIQIQIQNSLLLPIYSFGHTYIQFVFKYNNIHT